MWSLALAALAALSSVTDGACVSSFEPRDKSVRRLQLPPPPYAGLTWTQAAAECNLVAPGFGMLGRDFLWITDQERALCGDSPVPLGLRGTPKGNIVWGTSSCLHCNTTLEDVNAQYLMLKLHEKRTPTSDSYRVGSLNLATNQWRLASNDTTFACVLCQKAWVGWLGRTHRRPRRPRPFLWAYTFRLSNGGSGNETADVVGLVVDRFNRSGNEVQIETLDSDANGTLYRMRSTVFTVASGISWALDNAVIVESWQDMSWCPAGQCGGYNWTENIVGNTAEKRLADFKVVTRRCVAKARADGDYDAVWEDDVDSWIDRGAECRSRPIRSVLRTLRRFVARPPLDFWTALTRLVNVTAEIPQLEWPLVNAEAFYPYRSNFSEGILSSLSTLLTGIEPDSELSVQENSCNKGACVFVTNDLQATNDSYAVAFGDRGVPKFLHGVVADDRFRPAIVLRVSSQLNASGHVAMHTFHRRNVGKAPLFKAIHNLVLKASTAVVVHVTSSTSLATWRRKGVWPLTFEVDNARSRNSLERYFPVWNLGDSEATSRPCPLTKSVGSVDIFVCNLFESDDRNFTAGRFLVYHGIDGRDSYLVRFIDSFLRGYGDIPVDESALQAVAGFVSQLIDDEQIYKIRALTSSATILSSFNGSLEHVLHGVVLTGPFMTASRRHVKVLVSNLNASDPAIGFSFDRLASAGAVQTVTATSRNVSVESATNVVLSANVENDFSRVEILAVTNSEDFFAADSLRLSKKLMAVNLVLFSKNEQLDASSKESVYLDIQLKTDRVGVGGENRRFQVATWSNATNGWSVSTCAKLRSTRGAKQVFRCEHLTFRDNALHGRYLVFEQSGFTDVLGAPLLAVLIAAGALSGVSLASIAGTAAALPAWRKDLGHKILLHMALALSFNLALGFTSSLISVDTDSFACIAVGALRHFSYLAMFAWMLVMSSLQLSRLLSVLGAKNTPNLLLKVSVFAWGLPTVTIFGLLTFNHKVYQSDAEDRGFCYPEGVAFVWSVQAPAATILTLNAAIFMVILARLYGLRGWGQSNDLRRHQNERTFQMHRMRAVFFTFCLFGITWVFHLLAEQGVFEMKYLYEYLFLITASVHVFSLSCIFVFFEKETRAEMLKLVTPGLGHVENCFMSMTARLCSLISRVLRTLRRSSTRS